MLEVCDLVSLTYVKRPVRWVDSAGAGWGVVESLMVGLCGCGCCGVMWWAGWGVCDVVVPSWVWWGVRGGDLGGMPFPCM